MTTRSLLSILCCLLLAGGPGYSAFHAATAWDVRTTGSDANGGGFQEGATGTDRSVADAVFQAYTDILIGATTTQGTSAAHAFGVTTPGNVFNITGTTAGSCTVQRVQAVSQAAGVVTFDKSLGTAGSTCIGVQGGGLQTIQAAATLAVGSNSIYVKSGTYTLTSVLTLNNVIQSVVGYNSSHLDLGTSPLITTATDSTVLFSAAASTSTYFINVSMANTAAIRAVGVVDGGSSGGFLVFDKCTIDGVSSAAQGSAASWASITLKDSVVRNTTNKGFDNIEDLYLIGSWIHHAGAVAADVKDKFVAINSLVTDNVGGISGTQVNRHMYVVNSTIANNGSDGILVGGTNTERKILLQNSIFYGNSGWGLAVSSTANLALLLSGNNGFGANTRGKYGITASATPVVPQSESGIVTLVSNPFTNSAGNDYTLNSAAGGGAILKSVGFPGILSGGGTGYMDIGAFQAQAAAAGGTVGAAFAQ